MNLRPYHCALVASIMICGMGCTASGRRPTGVRRTDAAEQINKLLKSQAAAWNEGDIDAFMDGYWHSPELTFSSGGRVTRGWQSTLDGYRKRYPSRAAMGRLTFSDLEVRSIGENVAMVLGRWNLQRDEPVGGNFTLVLRRDSGRWLIIHDHTSRSPS